MESYQDALRMVDDTSGRTVAATDAGRGLLLAFSACSATAFAMIGFAPWPAVLTAAAGVMLCAVLSYVLHRRRARPRPLLSMSGTQIGLSIALMAFYQVMTWWRVDTWGAVGVKWVALFGVTVVLMTGMRRAAMRHRLKDAHERPH